MLVPKCSIEKNNKNKQKERDLAVQIGEEWCCERQGLWRGGGGGAVDESKDKTMKPQPVYKDALDLSIEQRLMELPAS